MAANLIFMLEQWNKTVLEISILVSGLGLNASTNKLLRGRTTKKLSIRKEQVKSYFANIVFKFEQLWMAEQEIQ